MISETDVFAKKIYDFHHYNQPLRKSDCILLLGSHDPSVAEYTAELFHKKWADKIIVSGGVMRNIGELRIEHKPKLEAHALADILIECGVSPENIIIEDRATNTGENFIFTKELLKKLNLDFQDFILTQKPYMLRRTFATAGIQFSEFRYLTSSQSDTYEQYMQRCEANGIDRFKVISNMTGDLQRLKVYPERGFMISTEIPEDVWYAYEKLVEAGFQGRMAN